MTTIRHGKLDHDRCKADVWEERAWHGHQCLRRAKRDGWCAQHHPDAEKERRRKRDERDLARAAKSPEARLTKAQERIKELTEVAWMLLANAILIPDPRMKGTTDVYAVPIDDIEELKRCLHGN